MEFEKFYCLIKEVCDNNSTNQILGVAKAIKNGNDFSLTFSFNKSINSPIYVEVYNINNKVFAEFIKDYTIKLDSFIFQPNLSISVYSGANLIGFYGDLNVLKECAKVSLFDDNEESIEKIIDNEMKLIAIDDARLNFNIKDNENKLKVEIDTKLEPIKLDNNKKPRKIKDIILKPLYRKVELHYFKQIEKSLCELFANCARERVLECMFSNSKWVRAETPNGIMVIGIIYSNNRPIKIGIGYPIDIAKTKFKDTKLGRMFYYPISLNTKFGYYLVFKSANNGKTCKI